MLFVAEVFGNRETRQSNAKARTGRLGHLSVNERTTGFFAISRYDDATLRHFQPQVISFASSFTDAREHRYAAMLHGDVVNELHDQHGFTDTGATEKPDLATLHVWLDEVDDFNAGFEHL